MYHFHENIFREVTNVAQDIQTNTNYALPAPNRGRAKPPKVLKPYIRALTALHSVTCPASMQPKDLEKQRRGQELLGRLISPISGTGFEPFSIGDMNAAWVTPAHGFDRNHAILFCHGGGYTSGTLGYSRLFASRLANATGYQVLCFEYRLAPENPYPAAVEDAVRAWDYLMYHGFGARDIVLAGDSAGGNLALVLAHRLKGAGRRLPSRMVLVSPWTDMTLSGRSYHDKEMLDPMLSLDYLWAVRSAYAGNAADYASPDLSPLFGDFSGFPPILVQVGSNELLLSDSIRLRDRVIRAGGLCRLEVWRDMFHVFQTFPIKKAAEAVEHIGDFIGEQFY